MSRPFFLPALAAASMTVVAAGGGHIFNLGHGVLPQIAPEMLTRVVDYVHSVSGENR